jgi:hypothetical protein
MAFHGAPNTADIDKVAAEADNHGSGSLRTHLAGGIGPRLIHQVPHALDCGIQSGKDRLSYQKVPNVELLELGYGGDGTDGIETQAVTGMAFEPGFRGKGRALPDP